VRKSPSENGQPPNAAKLSVSYALLGVTKLRRAYWTNGNCVKHAMKTDVSEARARAKPASSRFANTQIDASHLSQDAQFTVAPPQHFLYFFPEPQEHGSFRPTFGVPRRGSIVWALGLTCRCERK
jgi:hypothetical protein